MCNMKKKILAAALAFSAMIGSTAFAQSVYYPADENDTKAILMCYDENGVLVYSNMYKAENGGFNMELPEKYEGSIKKAKAYLVDTKRFKDIDLTADMPAETPAPTQTPSATQPPAATAKPTSEPSQNKFPAIYEKALDAIYAPGVVKEVETREGKDGAGRDTLVCALTWDNPDPAREIASVRYDAAQTDAAVLVLAGVTAVR